MTTETKKTIVKTTKGILFWGWVTGAFALTSLAVAFQLHA